MPQVEFTGWKRGFNKVHFTRALRDLTDLGLKARKQITDTILDGDEDDTHYFEVLWAQGADTFVLAQLAEDGWFYVVRDGPPTAETFDDWVAGPMSRLSLVAVRVHNLGKLLRAYDLVFPETFVLPLTPPAAFEPLME